MANSNFYANNGLNAGFTRSQSSSSSHTEGAAVTTLKPMDENSSITYSNVNSITYQGTQAQGGTFIYNNVANIQKEAVELHNSYTSSSSSRGINAGATIGYGHKIQTTGNGGNISACRSNRNTVETIHANGSFTNVNEVHNNTGTMTLSGFNQEGGKVTGNIGNLVVESRQNTSTTTGSSSGISANGVPSSVTINASRTNGNRAFVDNQSTSVVGEGSNLHVETVENTGAVIGKEGNSTFKIDTHSRTNINVEPQVIEYISNPSKFKEDLEVAILEGKATGETVLKSIENIVNGGKEDIGDPERRAINEIKEAVIRVKTAPQMESIAKGDLNSPNVLEKLGIAAIEKFNPDNPDLPENVRARLDELAEDGKTIKAFYDKTTNKIFVNENLTDDSEIRASIAREWKISEDLKDGKGKSNEEGQLKATVAGELAYDDMMKRRREGKTESISTDRFADTVMDEDSEVTADGWVEDGIKWVKGTRAYKTTEKTAKWTGKQINSIIDAGARTIKNTGIIDMGALAGRTTVNIAVGGYNVTKNY